MGTADDSFWNTDQTATVRSHCDKDSLTDFYGWASQGILAALAFSCLIGKRFCEDKKYRRNWEIWWYDTSKQGIGALIIHMTNVYLAPHFKGNPCTWYIINFLLDSTIGLFIIYVGIRFCQYLAVRKNLDSINFGVYTAPRSWIYQTWIYVGLMMIIKLLTTLIIQMDYWENVKEFVLSPFKDSRIEVVMAMLVIPFFVNVLIFWVTDNFLMRHVKKSQHHSNSCSKPTTNSKRRGRSILEKVRVKYHAVNKKAEIFDKRYDSESDHLISSDEEIQHFPSSNSTNVVIV